MHGSVLVAAALLGLPSKPQRVTLHLSQRSGLPSVAPTGTEASATLGRRALVGSACVGFSFPLLPHVVLARYGPRIIKLRETIDVQGVDVRAKVQGEAAAVRLFTAGAYLRGTARATKLEVLERELLSAAEVDDGERAIRALDAMIAAGEIRMSDAVRPSVLPTAEEVLPSAPAADSTQPAGSSASSGPSTSVGLVALVCAVLAVLLSKNIPSLRLSPPPPPPLPPKPTQAKVEEPMPAAPEPAAARADGSYAQAEALLIEKADTDAPPAEPESAPPPSPLEKGADVKVVSQPSEMSERTSFQDVVERARVANTASKSRLEVDQGENPSPAGEKDALAASGDMADEEGAVKMSWDRSMLEFDH